MKTKEMVRVFLSAVLYSIPVLLFFSLYWQFRTWNSVNLNEVIFHLTTSLKGAARTMVKQYILWCAVPTFLVFLLILLLLFFAGRKNKSGITGRILALLAGALFLFDIGYAWKGWNIGSYIDGRLHASTFIEANYADPAEVQLTFPEKKKNLIYIYLESMEVTDVDLANGGGFSKNRIPELTELAKEYEDFSGSDETLNGAFSMPGTDWTMGGIFAQTTGLPLQIAIDINAMHTQSRFFPGATALGDILKSEGYHQVFLIGSEASFGGRLNYFEEHGGFEIDDYEYAKQRGWIPEDYSVWWGYEDRKLFAFSKTRLQELAKEDKPFNLTILTTDTHFEDGYRCELCGDEFGNDQYANAYACSSRQVTDFVDWIREQDFYEDTAVILCGDHPTMDADYCNDVDPSYLRKTYMTILNAAAETEDPSMRRDYTTFDMFPTTLAAMGVAIDGDRLGLGTNLFSATPTLTEEKGFETVREEVDRQSAFMETLAAIDYESEQLKAESAFERMTTAVTVTEYDKEKEEVLVTVSDIENMYEALDTVTIEFYDNRDSSTKETVRMEEKEKGVYTAALSMEGRNTRDVTIDIFVNSVLNNSQQVYRQNGDVSLKQVDLTDYIYRVKEAVFEEREPYMVFISTRKNITSHIPDEAVNALRELGLSAAFSHTENHSYAAVVGKDILEEKIDKDSIRLKGYTPDKKKYEIRASWSANREQDYGIYLDGENSMQGLKGLHFTIYNYETGVVEDAVAFDLLEYGTVRYTNLGF